MTGPLQILILGADAKLREECEAALAAAAGHQATTQYLCDFHQAAEAARTRRPQFAIAEMGVDLDGLKCLAADLTAASPETLLIAAFRPEAFGHEASESAVLIDALRLGVRDFLRRPISAVDMTHLIERTQRTAAPGPARFGKIVSFMSNKGGVGKSTLSVNTAIGLARRHPDRVLLIDASLQTGVCAAMLDLEPTLSLADAARERSRLDELLLRQLATPHRSGLHLLAAPADAMEGADVNDKVLTRVLTLARRAYDFVIVNTFPMFDRAMMAVLDQSDRVYIVVENIVPMLLGAAKLVKLLASVGYPVDRQRVVLNRYSSRNASLPPHDVARRLTLPVDHVIPYDRSLITAANLGEPLLARRRPFSSAARRMTKILDDIERIGSAAVEHNGPPAPPPPAIAEPAAT